MNHLSLFSGGCDGFSVAAKWMRWTNIAHVEIDKWNQKLLRQNFPGTEVYGDIREFNAQHAAKYRGSIDIITGGFPCQPFSTAGKRQGTADDNYLWPPMLETIGIIKPAFVVGENVAGLTSMEDGRTFDQILADLENEGYTVESFILPACSVGAWHRRNRIFIVAYGNSSGLQRQEETIQSGRDATGVSCQANAYATGSTTYAHGQGKPNGPLNGEMARKSTTHTSGKGLEGRGESGICSEAIGEKGQPKHGAEISGGKKWQAEPGVDRVVHGLPDRTHRVKALGNAVVPQVAYEILRAIEQTFEL